MPSCALGAWDHRRTTRPGDFRLYIEPTPSTEIDLSEGVWLSIEASEPERAEFLPADRIGFEDLLHGATDEQMSGLWEQRNYYDKWVRAGGRRQIWEELQRRYRELPNSPIKVSLPRDM